MDSSKFDQLTKAIATATSRRQALKAIGASVVGGILGLGGVGTALAMCKGIGVKCSQSKECCVGYCDPSTFTCTCPIGTVLCGDHCVSNVCPDGQTFDSSSCQCTCSGGLTACGSTCIDTSSDPNNCGSCGHHCPPDAACVNGTCVCSLGNTACGGICTNLLIDNNNCGSCGHVCPPDSVCENATCACLTVVCGGHCCPPCPVGEVPVCLISEQRCTCQRVK